MIVGPVEQHLQDGECLIGMRVMPFIHNGVEEVANVPLGYGGNGFVVPVLEPFAGNAPSHLLDGAWSRFCLLPCPVTFQEVLPYVREAIGRPLDHLVARGRLQHLLWIAAVSGGRDDRLRAIPRRFQIEPLVFVVHAFRVSTDRVAAFLPLTGNEHPSHDHEGLAATLGDSNTEPGSQCVPKIFLYLIGLQVLYGGHGNSLARHLWWSLTWYLFGTYWRILVPIFREEYLVPISE